MDLNPKRIIKNRKQGKKGYQVSRVIYTVGENTESISAAEHFQIFNWLKCCDAKCKLEGSYPWGGCACMCWCMFAGGLVWADRCVYCCWQGQESSQLRPKLVSISSYDLQHILLAQMADRFP